MHDPPAPPALVRLFTLVAAQPAASPATTGCGQAMDGMMMGMDRYDSVDPDRDCVTRMLLHPHGGVDLMRVERRNGRPRLAAHMAP